MSTEMASFLCYPGELVEGSILKIALHLGYFGMIGFASMRADGRSHDNEADLEALCQNKVVKWGLFHQVCRATYSSKS